MIRTRTGGPDTKASAALCRFCRVWVSAVEASSRESQPCVVSASRIQALNPPHGGSGKLQHLKALSSALCIGCTSPVVLMTYGKVGVSNVQWSSDESWCTQCH